MQYSDVMAEVDAGKYVIPAGWTQGRACFGGLIAAIMYRRLQALVPDRPPRSLFVSFVGPVAAGDIELNAEVLRTGGSVTQAECKIIQDGEVVAVMQAAFGLPRESRIRVAGPKAPDMKPLEKAFKLPFVEGISPEFLRFFELRWATKPLPFSKSKEGYLGGWIRFREKTNIDHSAMLALIDAWAPAVMPMYRGPAPSSSLTWTIEFVQNDWVDNDWWQFHAETEHAADGYCVTQGQIWTEQGELIALTRQTVTIYA
ncbi:MAG TPA: thioesterase family protein [Alcanivoracaceae bacterium]|nr:thioesterase family protein [Alcanivoracaceae bacterium]